MSRCAGGVVARPHEIQPTGGLTREFRHGWRERGWTGPCLTIILIIPPGGSNNSVLVMSHMARLPPHQRCFFWLECAACAGACGAGFG